MSDGIVGVIAGIFVVVGVAGLLNAGDLSTVIVDRRRGVLTMRHGIGRSREDREIPLDAVAAVQVCSWYDAGHGDSPSYIGFELNLVLGNAAAERVHLVGHGNERRLRRDAQSLATFMDRPLLDHG